jgi:hypothetical protein
MKTWVLGYMLAASAIGAPAAPLLQSDEVLDITLRGPLRELLSDEAGEPRAFHLASGSGEQAVHASIRGKSRRKVCSFPPLRLDFERAALPEASNGIFDDLDMLRLTTHCRDQPSSQADVIEEYLAYRIFNLISDYSYRVRLLRATYVDTGESGATSTHYAFAVESERHLARRLGGEVLEVGGLPKARLNELQAARVYVFQYLIGNTDWSLVPGTGDDNCCHNGQLIDMDSEILYVPYDFDLSGLVNARYARPDPSLRIDRVTTRVYRGYCGPAEALSLALHRIVGLREAIIDLVRDAPGLSASERARNIRYLEGFFKKARKPEKILGVFERKCLG